MENDVTSIHNEELKLNDTSSFQSSEMSYISDSSGIRINKPAKYEIPAFETKTPHKKKQIENTLAQSTVQTPSRA